MREPAATARSSFLRVATWRTSRGRRGSRRPPRKTLRKRGGTTVPHKPTADVTRRPFGSLPDGTGIEQYSLVHGSVALDAITYGGIVTSLRVPDRSGESGNVVLGYDCLEPYLSNRAYLGAIIGRCANRIARGRFSLDGRSHQLSVNEPPNHLHGGTHGFDQRVWTAEPLATSAAVGVRFRRASPSLEEGYPGTLEVSVTYLLTSSQSVVLHYEAVTDAPTIVALTQHTYFNLSAGVDATVLEHELAIHADRYLPVDRALIPTGEVAAVDGTPFDLRRASRVGERLARRHAQLKEAGGFDHNFVLARQGDGLASAAELRHPASGRTLHVLTTEPGVQFYAGQMLDRAGSPHRFPRHAGLCLETQHFPDSPNRPQFPSVGLAPRELYRSTTEWQFSSY